MAPSAVSDELLKLYQSFVCYRQWRHFCRFSIGPSEWGIVMSEERTVESDHMNEKESDVVDITTKTGDKGTSSLYNGNRLPKSDDHFQALGSLDELNSFIGLAREYLDDRCQDVDSMLEKVQCILFDVCASVATPLTTSRKAAIEKTKFDPNNTQRLEAWCLQLDKELPRQDSFLLPVVLREPNTL